MANIKITDLPELSETPNDANLLEIVDKASETPTSKKITWANIKAAVLTAVGKVNEAVGFTLSGGTTSKTLTVEDTMTLKGYATAAEITTGTEAAKAIAPDQLKLSSPTFANITDSGLTASQMVCTDADKKLVSKAYATAAEITTGTESAKAIAPDQLKASGIGLIGSEMFWPTETPPTGWLEEDGSSLVRATYPALFALIGTMYGAADGTHFNLPDMRGKFPRIWAHGQTTDPDKATRTVPTTPGATLTAGDHVGTEQADALEEHRHMTGATIAAAGADVDRMPNHAAGINDGLYNTTGAKSATTNDWIGGNETRPINTYRMMIIKAY